MMRAQSLEQKRFPTYIKINVFALNDRKVWAFTSSATLLAIDPLVGLIAHPVHRNFILLHENINYQNVKWWEVWLRRKRKCSISWQLTLSIQLQTWLRNYTSTWNFGNEMCVMVLVTVKMWCSHKINKLYCTADLKFLVLKKCCL